MSDDIIGNIKPGSAEYRHRLIQTLLLHLYEVCYPYREGEKSEDYKAGWIDAHKALGSVEAALRLGEEVSIGDVLARLNPTPDR